MQRRQAEPIGLFVTGFARRMRSLWLMFSLNFCRLMIFVKKLWADKESWKGRSFVEGMDMIF
uniref:Uncharacterized protein n=1 Tax=Octopus bimaculoides TaxID=37653 RepID=A0A0L8IA00_OCTBM